MSSDRLHIECALRDIVRLMDAVRGNQFEQHLLYHATEIKVELERQLLNVITKENNDLQQ